MPVDTSNIRVKGKKAKEFCNEINEYLKKRTGIPVPSLEDFCNNYDYVQSDINTAKSMGEEVRDAIYKINMQAIITLEKFLILDTSMMEFKADGKTYKLDKKGIIHQLKYLRSIVK